MSAESAWSALLHLSFSSLSRHITQSDDGYPPYPLTPILLFPRHPVTPIHRYVFRFPPCSHALLRVSVSPCRKVYLSTSPRHRVTVSALPRRQFRHLGKRFRPAGLNIFSVLPDSAHGEPAPEKDKDKSHQRKQEDPDHGATLSQSPGVEGKLEKRGVFPLPVLLLYCPSRIVDDFAKSHQRAL